MTVEKFYDDIAAEYDELRYGSDHRRQIARIELDFIRPYLKGTHCLEVGAGTGRVTNFLVDYFDSVTAVDQSTRMLEILRRNVGPRSNLTTEVANIYELDQVDGYGRFSDVACFRVLPHLEEPVKALKRLRGAVTADGMVFFDLWNSWGYDAVLKRIGIKKKAVYTDYVSVKQMHAFIKASGLRIVAHKGVGFPPLELFLPLEKSAYPGLDYIAQRILWVCQPK